MEQSLMDKLTILADSAKYDVACTSSGAYPSLISISEPTLPLYISYTLF